MKRTKHKNMKRDYPLLKKKSQNMQNYILSYSRLFLIAHSRGLLMGKFSDMALL